MLENDHCKQAEVIVLTDGEDIVNYEKPSINTENIFYITSTRNPTSKSTPLVHEENEVIDISDNNKVIIIQKSDTDDPTYEDHTHTGHIHMSTKTHQSSMGT